MCVRVCVCVCVGVCVCVCTITQNEVLARAKQIEFLGHQIRVDVITPSLDNQEKVRKTPMSNHQEASEIPTMTEHFAEISELLSDPLKIGKS